MGLGLTGLSENGFEPPDVQVAAGPTRLVEMVNLDLAVWTKTGAYLGASSLSTFFATGVDSLSDPRVLYDAVSGRWLASIFDVDASTVTVAVSMSADPGGGWSLYRFSLPGCPDQPRLGVDDNQVLVSINLFSDCSQSASYLGARVAVISKSAMLSGASAPWQLFGASTLFAVAAAQSLGASPAGWMASVDPNASTVVHLFEVIGTPPSTTISQSDLSISPAIQTPPNAAQPSGPPIATDDNRIQDAVWQAGRLYLTFNDACVSNSVVYSCGAAATVSTTAPAILWRTDFGSSGADSFYPAARPDPGGNLLVAFGISSPTIYPSGAVVAFLANGQFVPTAGTIQAGSYPVLGSRYGDYFGAAVDPSHPHTIWSAAEVGNQLTGAWGTAIRAATIDPEAPSAGTVGLSATPGLSQASVTAGIDPAGTNTGYTFQYGTTTAYSSQTTAGTLAGGTAAVAVSSTLGSLRAHTQYHVRVVAANAAGTVYGPDSTFTTAGPPPPPPVILPAMTQRDAKLYVRQELVNRFRSAFGSRRQYTASCSRDSRTQMRCRTSWISGKYSYTGTVIVFYVAQNGTISWRARLRIKRVNASCQAARPKHRCPAKIYT